MSRNEVQDLIRKYNRGTLTPEEESELEVGIEQGLIQLEDLEDIQILSSQLVTFFQQHLSESMHRNFDLFLEEELRKSSRPDFWQNLHVWWMDLWRARPAWQLVYSTILVATGIGLGSALSLRQQGPAGQVNELSLQMEQMQQMQEQIMLALIDKESTTERLKAVSLTNQMDDVSSRITNALLHTLNFDPNVNVRLAALEVLYKYATIPEVRKGLIKSILQQESPLVQMALAEVMADLQEPESIKYLENIIRREETPAAVKMKIRKNVEQLL